LLLTSIVATTSPNITKLNKKQQATTSNCNGILSIAFGKGRLYLKTIWLFSFAHLPLSIPRSDIAITKKTIFGFPIYVLLVGKPKITIITVFKRNFPDI